jgi:hypothetical protein
MKKRIDYPPSGFTPADLERIRAAHGTDAVWSCRANGADALAVRGRDGDVWICAGSVVAPFDGAATCKFLLHRRTFEAVGSIADNACVRDCATCSFEWAAVVVTARADARASDWFEATPESLSGRGVVEVAEDALDEPFENTPLVDDGGPFFR